MPEPVIEDVYAKQQTKYQVPLDQFFIRHGYKDRSSVQIRLEKDGHIYMSDSNESRSWDREKLITTTVPFKLFIEHWPQFIVFLRARAAEAAGGE
jgi:hypothetical protein